MCAVPLLLGRLVSEYGRLCHGDGPTDGATAPPEGASVGYPRRCLSMLAMLHWGRSVGGADFHAAPCPSAHLMLARLHATAAAAGGAGPARLGRARRSLCWLPSFHEENVHEQDIWAVDH